MEFPVNDAEQKFLRDKHVKYCLRCLGVLPERCQSIDSSRVVTAFFAISALDHLNALDNIEDDKQHFIDWIYSMQVVASEDDTVPVDYGFRGSTSCMISTNNNSDLCDKAHIAMTYTALATLIILGDDLSKVQKENILSSLKELQLPDGSFRPMNIDCESDMRFVYCAACVCYILQDWSSIDVEKTIQYIQNSRNYDGGIGQGPGLESHGGSTYCAVAALWLMGRLESTFTENDLRTLKRWLVFRQNHGFHGRPNKPDDTCYTFWVGATLKLLDSYEFVNYSEVSRYVLSTQDEICGGIAKWVDYCPDVMHTYLGISGLFLHDKGSPLTHPGLNISHRAANYLSKLHKQWKVQS
ncbi:geranylgeranyl transferase type-1 subunit beta-like [Argiope bruennichi]|uniref:Geranylgeranyl transferase type-1 subunit beta n=1 Tax=Argiope bruennichi TaxID=94029 RepID=A0A8T0FZX5_ARGBR|nr:geranylgeranyl transferase type-1 subunit beta-like [Argiope bruennichi]KAF8795805.1 Geranylgeranyl transferase type-1 subunit like protein [Argiope bruennichi]